MVLQGYGIDAFAQGVRQSGEGDRARVDGDERKLGRANSRGFISAVENATTGAVLVRVGRDNEIPATITKYHYPIPKIGHSVSVNYSIDGAAFATPTAPELPQGFTGKVVIARGSGDVNVPHSAIVEHRYRQVGNGNRRVLVFGGVGVELTVNDDPTLSDIVVCVIDYHALVGVSAADEHTIYAVANRPVIRRA